MQKDTLIHLYWILDSLRNDITPNRHHVEECFISTRDELMLPDTEEIVAHIQEAWQQSLAAADVLTNQVIGYSQRQALPDKQLIDLMSSVRVAHLLPTDLSAQVALSFGRLVEAAHGIKKPPNWRFSAALNPISRLVLRLFALHRSS